MDNYDSNQQYNVSANQGLSFGEWMLTLLLTFIPCVNIIMLLVWAFGSENERKNFARAYLVWFLIGAVLTIISYALIFSSILASMN